MPSVDFSLDQAFVKARDAIQPHVMPQVPEGGPPAEEFHVLLRCYARAWEEEIYRATELNWGTYDEAQVSNWILAKSLEEWKERLEQPGFYAASARAFACVLHEPGGLIERLKSQTDGPLLELGRQLVWDAERMLTMMGRSILHLSINLGSAYRANVAKPPDLVGSWEFLAFGATHRALPPFSRLPASVAVLRMALELYIKQCFGIVCIRKCGSREPVILGLESVLSILKKLECKFPNEVTSEVTIDTLRRINKWANITLHSGVDMFYWAVLWAGRLLMRQVVRPHPSFQGVRIINFGLKLSPRVYKNGREEITQYATELYNQPVEIVEIAPCCEIMQPSQLGTETRYYGWK